MGGKERLSPVHDSVGEVNLAVTGRKKKVKKVRAVDSEGCG